MAIRFDNLGINLPYIPRSIEVMGYEITILGILLAVSMIIGITCAVLDAKRRNQNQDFILGAICMAVIGAVIGGRLFYVAFSWNLFKSDLWEIVRLRNGGMAYYGALIGGMLLVSILCKIGKVSFGETADNMTVGILIVQIFTRLGDFFNRESFGQYTEWPVAMQLPLSSVRSSEVSSMMRENLLTIDGSSWIQVHPVFLYDMVWCILLLLFLLIIRRKKAFSGEVFLRYLAGYGLGRVFVEYFRTDQLWIPETTYPISMILAAASFILFTITVSISRSLAMKRAAVKKRHAEEFAAQKAEFEENQPVDIDELLREEEEYQRSLENPTPEAAEDTPATEADEISETDTADDSTDIDTTAAPTEESSSEDTTSASNSDSPESEPDHPAEEIPTEPDEATTSEEQPETTEE